MRLDWKTVLGTLVTVLLLWWILRDVQLAEVWAAIKGADFLLLGLAVAVSTVGFAIRAIRWKILLHPIRPDVRFRPRFAAVSIGFMANNLLPARVGEFARAYALSRLEPVSAGGAFGSLVVERFLDGVTVLSLLALAIALPDFPSGNLPPGLAGSMGPLLGVLSAVLGSVVVLILFPGPVIRLAEAVAVRFPGRVGPILVTTLESFLGGLTSLRSPALLFRSLVWSFAFWMWHSWSFWIGARAFGMDISYTAALFLNGVVAFAVAVPSTPGFFGTFHAGVKIGLVDVYGFSEPAALGFAFGQHLGGFVPITLIGLWYAWRMGLSVGEVEREAPAEVEEELLEDTPGQGPPGSHRDGGP